MTPVDVATLPVFDWASSSLVGIVVAVCVFAAICLAFGAFAYILIARFEVVPKVRLGRKGFRLNFERLPPASGTAESGDS